MSAETVEGDSLVVLDHGAAGRCSFEFIGPRAATGTTSNDKAIKATKRRLYIIGTYKSGWDLAEKVFRAKSEFYACRSPSYHDPVLFRRIGIQISDDPGYQTVKANFIASVRLEKERAKSQEKSKASAKELFAKYMEIAKPIQAKSSKRLEFLHDAWQTTGRQNTHRPVPESATNDARHRGSVRRYIPARTAATQWRRRFGISRRSTLDRNTL